MTHKFAIQILASKMLLCYFVTSSFFATTQKGGKNCKSAENQSYIKPDPKTIREKVAHDDNDNNNNNNNRDETTVPSHFTLHFTNCMANAMTDSYIRTSVNC